MLTENFVNELHCPYCGFSLRLEARLPAVGPELRYGILRCACFRFLIVDGILDLRQGPLIGPADVRRFEKYLQAKDEKGALAYALAANYRAPSPRVSSQRFLDYLERGHIPFTRALASHQRGRRFRQLFRKKQISFQQTLELLYPKRHAAYFFQRYANPSFLAAHALLPLLRELFRNTTVPGPSPVVGAQLTKDHPRVLDLGCGLGHSTFRMCQMFPNLSVVATDLNFINLFVAKKFIAPRAQYLCIDAESPLPFGDSFFDSVYCLDTFHYIRSKAALVRELSRAVRPGGLWLFAHLHNALADNVSPGFPLQPEDYLTLFERVRPRMLPEATVLDQLFRDQSLDLETTPSKKDLHEANAFCLVGDGGRDIWRRHERLADTLFENSASLMLNPIYQVRHRNQGLLLEMSWPNASLEKECGQSASYLPSRFVIEASVWNRIATSSSPSKTDPEIWSLVKSFSFVDLPTRYGSAVPANSTF